MPELTQDFVDTDPGLESPADIERQAKTMARFREIEAAARSAQRLIVTLIVVAVFLAWKGWI